MELRDRFAEYEKKLVEINNELISANKTSNLKDQQIEELSRRVLQVEEEEARKTRMSKMTLEEQLEKLRYQHIQDVRTLEEENRRLKEAEVKLEQKNKDLLTRDQTKERSIMEWERRVSDLEEKVNRRVSGCVSYAWGWFTNRLNKQLREQADQSDRLALEKEEANRKLAKESARANRLEQELREYEETEEARLKEFTELKKTAKQGGVSRVVNEEIVVRDEGFRAAETGATEDTGTQRAELEGVLRKNQHLKDKLQQANQKLVKMVSDKVQLLQKVAELGLDLTKLGAVAVDKSVTEVVTVQPAPTKSPLAVFTRDFGQSETGFRGQGEQVSVGASPPFGNTWNSRGAEPTRNHERELLEKRMKDIGGTRHLGDTAAKVFGLTTVQEGGRQTGTSPCPVHGLSRPTRGEFHGRAAHPEDTVPYLSSAVAAPPAKHLLPVREYTDNVQTLSEDDLQRKIQQLLRQKETFYNHA